MNLNSTQQALIICLLSLAEKGLTTEIRVPGDYATITAALAAANNGDTISVAAGTYSNATGETFPLRVEKAITLEGDCGNKPHLKSDGEHTAILIESGGVNLQCFYITNGKGSEGINNMDGGGVCIFVGPSETNPVMIDQCEIADNNCPSDETYDGCGGGIYCGGTYCECFQIKINDCEIRHNLVHGKGGGICCALLSNVDVNDTFIEDNEADDYGGGVFVDVFAVLNINDTHLTRNNSPGDPEKEHWGGKGSGLACESYGIFTASNCTFSQNTAKHFGGGIFTRAGGLEGEGVCIERPSFSNVSNCRIEKNLAKESGGGAYVASSAVLHFSGTTFYWNDANQPNGDGGAVFVAGGDMGGGIVDFNDDCLLEGNESARNGGGVYLGKNAVGTFESTRLLGNSSLFDGGALYLDTESVADLNNCTVTYNNSARGHAGGICSEEQSYMNLAHCTIVGNFAPRMRSGLYLDSNAIVNVTNSILWRNAGGSVEANGAAVNITYSLNEDVADPNNAVLCCDPQYVGWGGLDIIYVDSFASGAEAGTADSPYHNLQKALDGFNFNLALDSPCLGTASDGGNMGSDTSFGSTAGNITATLFIADGNYDIRGRNIIFSSGVQGIDPNTSIIRHAALGYIENVSILNLGITGEEIFGGIVIRADANFVNCTVFDNTALADGGGIYVAEGHCTMTNSSVSANTSSGNGGGFFASSGTNTLIEESIVLRNYSTGSGGGLYFDLDSVSSLSSSYIQANSAPYVGGGINLSGKLDITDVNLCDNFVTAGKGGGINIERTGDVEVSSCFFF